MTRARLGGRAMLEVVGLLAALGFVAIAFTELSRRLADRVQRQLPLTRR